MSEPSAFARPKIIGEPVPRVEDPRLLTGYGKYTDDRKLPGMLHIAIRRSDHAHARILGVDKAEAEAMPGVVGIYTAEDLESLARPVRATSRMKDYQSTPIRPLAKDKVRFAGEAVVAGLSPVVTFIAYFSKMSVGVNTSVVCASS